MLKGYCLRPDQVDSAVIFFHGYGATADDLVDIGHIWQKTLTTTAFYFPHGIEASEVNPFGYQWFGLREFNPYDTHSRNIINSLENIQSTIIGYIKEIQELHDIPLNKIILAGFSQGTMLALYTMMKLPDIGGVVGYSGIFYPPHSIAKISTNYPDVCLIHGQLDTLVPYPMMEISANALHAIGITVHQLTCPLLGHGINEAGIQYGEDFISKTFEQSQFSDKRSDNYEQNIS